MSDHRTCRDCGEDVHWDRGYQDFIHRDSTGNPSCPEPQPEGEDDDV